MNTHCDDQYRAEYQIFSTFLVWSATSCWEGGWYILFGLLLTICVLIKYIPVQFRPHYLCLSLCIPGLCTETFASPVPDCQFNILSRPGKYSCLVKFFSSFSSFSSFPSFAQILYTILSFLRLLTLLKSFYLTFLLQNDYTWLFKVCLLF